MRYIHEVSTFTYLLSVRPAVGQPWRTHIVTGLVADAEAYLGGAVAMVADYASRRYGNRTGPIVEDVRAGEWHVYNVADDGRRAFAAYGVIVTDSPREREARGVPNDARRVIVLNPDATTHPASNGEPYTR